MAPDPEPIKKLGLRQYIGGFGTMEMGFGVYSWTRGQAVPGGYTQTYGAVLFGVGLVCVLVAVLWPRKRS